MNRAYPTTDKERKRTKGKNCLFSMGSRFQSRFTRVSVRNSEEVYSVVRLRELETDRNPNFRYLPKPNILHLENA